MRTLPKPVLIAIIVIIVLTAGSLFLIRSCVFGKGKTFGGAPAGMREQFAHAPGLYLEKDGKGVILTIVSHLKIRSYSRQGNMVRKSASTTYYLQTNDASTAEMKGEIKLKGHTDIKQYPVEVLGATGSIAWIFLGEPMAFDAFTLEKKADISLLEARNRNLTGKFPSERRYYLFNPSSGTIFFTAMDGTKWELNTQTLQAQTTGEIAQSPLEQEIMAVESSEQKNQADQDSLYQRKNRRASLQYSSGEITSAEYNRLSREYRVERDILYRQRDSLRQLKRKLVDRERSARDLLRNLEELRSGNPGYGEIRINQDTINGKWYGLYSPSELKKLNDRLQYHAENDETARRHLYSSTYAETKTGYIAFDQASVTAAGEQNSYLHGGFLLDKNMALPLHLNGPASFLVVHKEQIGREGAIRVSRLGMDGKELWSFNTRLAEWSDWFCNGRELMVMGTDNKELSSGQVNALLCINLSTGKAMRYDYYTDKVIPVQ